MSGALNYDRQKQQDAARGPREPDCHYRPPRRPWRGLREEWDGPEFPVIVTTISKESPE